MNRSLAVVANDWVVTTHVCGSNPAIKELTPRHRVAVCFMCTSPVPDHELVTKVNNAFTVNHSGP